MSTEQQAPVWGTADHESAVPLGAAEPLGAPEPPKKMSRSKTIVAAAVAGVVVVGGGVAVVSAVNSSNSATNQNGFGGPGGGFGGGRGAGGFGAGGLSDALYGDFVASDGNGGYTTKRLQSGTVTAVSATSITAKSADGHTTTFALNSSTQVDNGAAQVSGVKTGDTVVVVGTLAGSTATASTITDLTLLQAAGGNPQGGPGANQQGGPGGGTGN